MNKKDLEKFLDYLQDKVEDCYKKETQQAISDFLKKQNNIYLNITECYDMYLIFDKYRYISRLAGTKCYEGLLNVYKKN